MLYSEIKSKRKQVTTINILDIIILGIIALCVLAGYYKGLIRTVYRLISFVIAMFIAFQISPYVARFLRQTQIFPSLQVAISRFMNFEALFATVAGPQAQANVIDSLPLPAALQALLHSYNTPDMFEILQVSTIEDYVTGFLANMVITGLAILLVFVVAMIAFTIVGGAIDIVSKLPVINLINRIGGALFGLLTSSAAIWFLLVVAAFFASNDTVYSLLEGSWVARFVFEGTLPQLATVVE